MSVIELNGNYYALAKDSSGKASVTQSYVTRLASAYRSVGVQKRQDDTSVNRYVSPGFPKGLGWARARRDTGRGVGGMLDSTAWTAKGPVALGKLQEDQSSTEGYPVVRYVNFKGDFWAYRQSPYTADANETTKIEKFGASGDNWTVQSGGGGGVASSSSGSANAQGIRAFDMTTHKGSIFVIHSSGHGIHTASADELIYGVSETSTMHTFADAANTGFPDSNSSNRYIPTAITRRNNYNDDMARLLSFGTMLFAAIYLHPDSTDGDSNIEVWSTVDAGTNWTKEATIPSGSGPKALVDWYDISRARVPVIVTAEGVYSIDTTANAATLMFALDGDPNNGRFSTVGTDGSLYVGLGSGSILRLTINPNGVLEIMNIGPPGDGLVTARQGYPTFLLSTPTEWLLVAYGGHDSGKYASIFMVDTSVILQDEETGKRYMPWHHMYQHATDDIIISTLGYSTEDDGIPRVHFTYIGSSSGDSAHIEEPFSNPEQTTTQKYQATSIIRMPDDDLGDPQSTTMVLQAFVDADDLTAGSGGSGGSGDEYIELRYGLNGASDTTTSLGDFLSGTLSQSFGSGAGIATRRIGINLLLDRSTTNTNTPKLHEFELQGHHVLQDKLAWEFVIDIAATARDYSPDVTSGQAAEEVIISNLETVAQSTTLLTFTAGRMTQTRVRVPNDIPPQFDLSVVDSFGQDTGRRTGFVRIRVEQGI